MVSESLRKLDSNVDLKIASFENWNQNLNPGYRTCRSGSSSLKLYASRLFFLSASPSLKEMSHPLFKLAKHNGLDWLVSLDARILFSLIPYLPQFFPASIFHTSRV